MLVVCKRPLDFDLLLGISDIKTLVGVCITHRRHEGENTDLYGLFKLKALISVQYSTSSTLSGLQCGNGRQAVNPRD